jgi:ubiquitin carboxyl-terminal hydrolase 36/42
LQHGPRYALYAVISHAGSGPNSGHYYAHVKGPDGMWYDANDESVVRTTSSSVIGRKNAYMLFYMRLPGDALGAAINLQGTNSAKKGVKRKSLDDEDEDEDRGMITKGLTAPSSSPMQTKTPSITPSRAPPKPDPQALKLQEKIAKVTSDGKAAPHSNVPLVPYSSDGEEEEDGEVREATPTPEGSSSPCLPPSSSSVALGTRSSSPTSNHSRLPLKKRKSPGDSDDNPDNSAGEAKRHRSSPPSENQQRDKQPPKRVLGNPFTASSMSNNLHDARGGASQGPSSVFNPPRPAHPQQIANVGRVPKVFHPRANGFAARMKPKRRPMI